jgi:hypothetical protein
VDMMTAGPISRHRSWREQMSEKLKGEEERQQCSSRRKRRRCARGEECVPQSGVCGHPISETNAGQHVLK